MKAKVINPNSAFIERIGEVSLTGRQTATGTCHRMTWIVYNRHRQAHRRDMVRVEAPDYSTAMNTAAVVRPRLRLFWFAAARLEHQAPTQLIPGVAYRHAWLTPLA